MTTSPLLSVLDLVPLASGQGSAQAIRDMVTLARWRAWTRSTPKERDGALCAGRASGEAPGRCRCAQEAEARDVRKAAGHPGRHRCPGRAAGAAAGAYVNARRKCASGHL
ncbi:hypothetical protein [Deinococcus sp.]|uniref:hypothetical protein n=1 Tax=Deinococcus sp. TaxID=47478 RepID=UPI0025D8CD5E|nr:hypothetical protein [Deinococcus sp.]